MCLTEENFSILLEFSGIRTALITHEVSTAKYSKKYQRLCDKQRKLANNEYMELDSKHLFKFMKKHHPNACLYFSISVEDVYIANSLITKLYEYWVYTALQNGELSFTQFIINKYENQQ